MAKKKEAVLVFDNSVKDKVVKSLGLNKKDSHLVDKDGKIAISQDFESINYDDFGGVLKGSKIPIKKKESELVKYFTSSNH